MELDIIDYSWQDKGYCKTEKKFDQETMKFIPFTTEDFFPPSGQKISKEVKEACKRCPIHSKCLDHAIRHEKYGEWAGTSEKERRTLRRIMGIKLSSPSSN